MTSRGATHDADPIRARYRVTYGAVPPSVDERLRVAETGLITTGAPAYALGIEIVNELLPGATADDPAG